MCFTLRVVQPSYKVKETYNSRKSKPQLSTVSQLFKKMT